MIKVIIIKFSNFFDDFRSQFDPKRQQLIEDEIIEYAKDPLKLPPPKRCDRYIQTRMKILLFESQVVAYYDDFGDVWKVVDGDVFYPRAG